MDETLKKKILDLLDQYRLMTLATNRPDGWPQATTVGYVNDGLTIYFLCSPQSQKAANLARDSRISLTVNHDVPDPMAITGLSMAAQAQPVADPTEIDKAMKLLQTRYPEYAAFPMPKPEEIAVYRVLPKVISVLDYSTKGLDTLISSRFEQHPSEELLMEHFTPVSASIGGVLIGLSATLLWLANGRIAGISGIVGGLWTTQAGDVAWRIAFVLGLIAAPVVYWMAGGELPHITVSVPWPLIMIAGLLVGFGTRLGGGCTSGHGVCGLARLSQRSLVATGSFMATAIVTSFILRHLIGL